MTHDKTIDLDAFEDPDKQATVFETIAAESRIRAAGPALLRLAREQRDEIAKVADQRDAILQEARIWAMEAKTQRGTVRDVGSVLGGIPDWGAISSGVASLRKELEEARGRIDRALEAIRDEDDPDAPGRPWLVDNVQALLSRPAPADGEQAEPCTLCVGGMVGRFEVHCEDPIMGAASYSSSPCPNGCPQPRVMFADGEPKEGGA